MTSTGFVNAFKHGQQLAADTSVCVHVYLDEDPPTPGPPMKTRLELAGRVVEDGRLWITHPFAFGADGKTPGLNMEVIAPGCKPWSAHGQFNGSEWFGTDPVNNSIDLVEGPNPFRVSPPVPPFIPAIPRGQVAPPFDQGTWEGEPVSFHPVYTDLPFTPPPPRTKRFRRENFCGLRFSDLPNIGNGSQGGCVFMPHLDRYPVEWQEKILRKNCERGFEWVTLSWPDSRDAGKSIADYVATCNRIKTFNDLWIDHHFFSKYYDPHNPDPLSVHDVIKALLDANVIDAATLAWEMDLDSVQGGGNLVSPEHVDTMVEGFDHMLPSIEIIPRYLHQSTHYISWQKNTNDSPHAYWSRKVGKITGQKYQAASYPIWSAGMQAARNTDCLDRLVRGGVWGLPASFDLVDWEISASEAFQNNLSENRCAVLGYEIMCSPGRMFPAGYGTDACFPDGQPL